MDSDPGGNLQIERVISLIPYLLLLLLSAVGGILCRKAGSRWWKAYLPVTGAAFWLVGGLRYVTGFDYRFYEALFQTASDTPLPALFTLEHTEPGFLLLVKLGTLTGSYQGFLLLFHLLVTLLVFLWIARWSENQWLSVTLFLCLQCFALSMNFLRQALAAAILLYTYRFLREEKLLPFCALVLLACTFHRTALIMLPFYLLLRLPAGRRHIIIAALAAAVLYFAMDPLVALVVRLFPHYEIYLESKYWGGNGILYVLPPLGCLLLALPLAQQKRPEDAILFHAVFYSFLIQCFITRHFILERFSIYLSGFALLALPAAANRVQRRWLWIALILAGGLAYLWFAASQGYHGVYPYRGLWDRAVA